MSGMKRRRGTFSFSPSLWHGSLVLCAELSLLRERTQQKINSTARKLTKQVALLAVLRARARVGKPAQAQVTAPFWVN